MIYLFEFTGLEQDLRLVSPLFPSGTVGIAIVAAAALLMLMFAVFHKRITGDLRTFLRWLVPGLAFVGTYIFFLRWVDEVFINLEHPWNLYHFGRYSFSPTQIVDGTVEVAYYLLLTPFAGSHQTLIIANMVLAGLLGLAHLYFIFEILADTSISFRTFAGICFALWWPLVCIFANGFGTSIVSLIFLGAIASFLKGRKGYLLLAALLPFVRIDAVACSAALFFADFCENRRPRWRYWFGCLAAFAGVLLSFRLYYGHWVPTPVAFKSFSPDMFSLIQKSDFKKLVLYFASIPHFVGATAAILGLVFWPTTQVRRLLFFIPPLGVLFVFYTVVSWNPTFDGRYYFGWEILLMLLPLVLAGSNFGKSELVWPCVILLLLAVSGLRYDAATNYRYTGNAYEGWRPLYTQRLDGLALGGVLIDRLVPRDWTISATELNTFGFMHDRPVVDLWGYTNPKIAHSRTFSPRRARHSPEVFLEANPDLHWHRTGLVGGTETQSADYEHFEPSFFTNNNVRKSDDNFGDMNQVITCYDFMILKTGKWRTTLMVRKDRSDTLSALLQKQDYRLSSSRSLDLQKFHEAYDSQ
jgi:hypothetical protein